jgi:hypothetical protein
MLSATLGWFTEGFDGWDYKKAKELVDALS